jgi:CubicO group peptidase (beta-lactamase class C family)
MLNSFPHLRGVLRSLLFSALVPFALPLQAQSVVIASAGGIESDQAARIHRVETSLVEIPMRRKEPPLRLNLEQLMHVYNDPGLSIAVIDNFQIVWSKGYGVVQTGTSIPVTEHTLFQAASISKPVTATAALFLVQLGKLSLDENVNDKLKTWKVPENEFTKTEKVTLRRILSHTAGLTVHGFPGYDVGSPLPTVVQILNGEKPANSPPVRVEAVPGTRQSYSGGGVTIEQQLLMDITDEPFPVLMRELVLDKIGMTESTFEQPLPPKRAELAASATSADGKMLHGKWHVYPEMAAAGLWTTPSDLGKFLIEIALSRNGKSNRVLSESMSRQMLTPVISNAGLGFFLPEKSQGEFGHSGSNEGFESNMKMNVESGQGLIIMGDSDNAFDVMQFVERAIAKEYGWRAKPSEPDAAAKLLVIALVKGSSTALLCYDDLKNANDPMDKIDEGTLNYVGERLLASGKDQDSIAVYQRNTHEHPASSKAYEGLAEAYSKTGQKHLAIQAYEKSLQLDPKNQDAIDQLKKLKVAQ